MFASLAYSLANPLIVSTIPSNIGQHHNQHHEVLYSLILQFSYKFPAAFRFLDPFLSFSSKQESTHTTSVRQSTKLSPTSVARYHSPFSHHISLISSHHLYHHLFHLLSRHNGAKPPLIHSSYHPSLHRRRDRRSIERVRPTPPTPLLTTKIRPRAPRPPTPTNHQPGPGRELRAPTSPGCVGRDAQRGVEGDAMGETGGEASGGASSGSGGARGEGAAVLGGTKGEEARGGVSTVSGGGGGGCEWVGEEGGGPIQGEGA